MSPEEQLVELRRRSEEAERLRLTREAQADQAVAARRAAEKRLAQEFECTPEQAVELLKQKEQELDQLMRQIEEALK